MRPEDSFICFVFNLNKIILQIIFTKSIHQKIHDYDLNFVLLFCRQTFLKTLCIFSLCIVTNPHFSLPNLKNDWFYEISNYFKALFTLKIRTIRSLWLRGLLNLQQTNARLTNYYRWNRCLQGFWTRLQN